MNTKVKIGIVVVLLAAVGGVVALKQQQKQQQPQTTSDGQTASPGYTWEDLKPQTSMPMILDLGGGICMGCKQMESVLDELQTELKGKLAIRLVNVKKIDAAWAYYQCQMIPTQVFYDVKGKELFRHVGPMSKEDVLAKWKELGYDFTEKK